MRLFHRPHRWPLTVQMSLLFASAIAMMLASVSVLMYSELVRDLQSKETAELKSDLQVQLKVLAAVAAHRRPDYWQREWQESRNAYGRFAWQLVAADGTVRDASTNWSDFTRRQARQAATARQVLVDAVRIDRAAGAGAMLRGALDVSQDMQLLHAYRRKVLNIGLLAIALAAGLAWPLVKFGLAPLDRFSEAIGRAQVPAMTQRWPAELRQLAAAFDDMLATLDRSYARISHVSSSLAYELRSPINNLMTASGVTLARARTPAVYQETLEVVVEEGNRLSHLLASMLFVVRAERGEQAVKPERLSLADEFRRLVEFFEVSFEERGVTLGAEGACELFADPLLLRRALSILLTHVLHRAGTGDAVWLSCAMRHETIVASVHTNGAGIAPEHMAFAFDRFHQADPACNPSRSIGVELAVVRSILALHGGTAIASSCPMEGACIDLCFPAVASRSPRHSFINASSI